MLSVLALRPRSFERRPPQIRGNSILPKDPCFVGNAANTVKKGLLVAEIEIVIHLVEVLRMLVIGECFAKQRLGWQLRRELSIFLREGILKVRYVQAMYQNKLPRADNHGCRRGNVRED